MRKFRKTKRLAGVACGVLAMFLGGVGILAMNGQPTVAEAETVSMTGVDFSSENGFCLEGRIMQSPVTFETWLQLPLNSTTNASGESYGVIFGNYTNEVARKAVNYEIGANGPPTVYWQGTRYIFDKVNVRTGEWVHLSIVRKVEEKQLLCYVNGEIAQTLENVTLKDTDTSVSNFSVGKDTRIIGNYVDALFMGKIHSVALFEDERTTEELAEDIAAKGDLNGLAGIIYAEIYGDLTEGEVDRLQKTYFVEKDLSSVPMSFEATVKMSSFTPDNAIGGVIFGNTQDAFFNTTDGYTDFAQFLAIEGNGSYKCKIEISGANADDVLNLYVSGMTATMTIGNITITQQKEDYIPTESELLGGYTFDWDNVAKVSYQNYAGGDSSGNFVDGYANISNGVYNITSNGNINLDFLKGVFQEGKKYTITFNFVTAGEGDATTQFHWAMWNLDTNTRWEAAYTSLKWVAANGTYACTIELEGATASDVLQLYANPLNNVVAISDITVKQYKSDYIPNDEELDAGYTFAWNDVVGVVYNDWVSSNGAFVDGTKNVENGQFKVTSAGNIRLLFTKGLFKADKKYTVEFTVNITEYTSPVQHSWRLWHSNTEDGYTDFAQYLAIEGTGEKRCRFEIIGADINDVLNLYISANNATMYIGDITITQHKVIVRPEQDPQPTDEQLNAGYTFNWEEITGVTFQNYAGGDNSGNFVDGYANIGENKYTISSAGCLRLDFTEGVFKRGYIYTLEFELNTTEFASRVEHSWRVWNTARGEYSIGFSSYAAVTATDTVKCTIQLENVTENDMLELYANGISAVTSISNIKITQRKVIVRPESDPVPTEAELLAGYTYKWEEITSVTFQNYAGGDNSNAYVDGFINVEEGKYNVASNGNLRLNFTKGVFQEGKEYTVTFNIITTEFTSNVEYNWRLWNSATDTHSAFTMFGVVSGTGTISCTLQVSGATADDVLCLYLNNFTAKMAIGNVTITQKA